MAQDETLDRGQLEALQRKKLGAMLREVLRSNPFWKARLGGLKDAASLPPESLPLTTRQDLLQDQLEHPPWGTNLTYPPAGYCRLHQTSGTASGAPLRCPDRAEDWEWWLGCWRSIYRAAGVRAEDRLFFPFSFGPFVGFWAAFEAGVSLGRLCLPGGGMSTTARLRFMLDNGATIVCCTPTYALRMAEAARQEGIDLAGSPVRGLIVAGEAGGSISATRGRIESAWGARVFDHAGMTEVGPYGLECQESPGGMHVLESEFIAEVIDPATGRPVAEGESGELVLTNLGRWGWPLIRYRTGDEVRLRRGRCACGRWFARLEGGLRGRIDDMLIIRGNNVYPSAIEAILREFAGVEEFRLLVRPAGGLAELRIEIEPAGGGSGEDLPERVAQAVRDRLNFRPDVTLVPPGSLPRFEMKARRVVHEG